MTKKALLMVDLQNDFLPGGALGVKGGDEIIPVINALQSQYECVVASKDWHPDQHVSFATTHNKQPHQNVQLEGEIQELWPEHCIQGTYGAELSGALNQDRITKIFYKGIDPNTDSYSAFYDNQRKRSTGLAEFLKKEGVDELVVVGLTTEYCVKYSVLDALELGFKTTVIQEGCRGVEIEEGDSQRAIEKMRSAGAHVI